MFDPFGTVKVEPIGQFRHAFVVVGVDNDECEILHIWAP
jgi:hypothetical protein